MKSNLCDDCKMAAHFIKSGRAEGYHQAEIDYHAKSERDRQSAYECGYEQGKLDAIDEILAKIQELKMS